MPEPKKLSIEEAWNELWKLRSPYYLPSTFKSRRHVGQTWLGYLPEVKLADTGPVVLLNKEPWGMVTVNLRNAAVDNLHTIEPLALNHDAATGEVKANFQFRQLRYAGDYEVKRGTPTASALKLASAQLRRTSTLDSGDPNDQISLARQYQDTLSLQSGPNGSIMLDSYYRHNDAYAQAFTNPKFATLWATKQTNGQNTSYYAGTTQTAASPGNTGTVSVNGTPDAKGYTPYNSHAFMQQLFLVATCNTQGNQDAATAASCFKTATDGPSGQSQTVDNVLGIVQNTPPPTQKCSSSQAMLSVTAEPDWKMKLRQEVQTDIEEIERVEDQLRRGILLREETDKPIHGQFSSYFPTFMLTLTGKLGTAPNGTPQVKFSDLTGPFGDVPVQLGIFPGNLHADLTKALDGAQFLKSLLGKRVINALAHSKLGEHLGHLLTVAMVEG